MQLTIFGLLAEQAISESFGKTCPESSAQTTTHSVVSWAHLQDAMTPSSRQTGEAGQTRVWLMGRGEPSLGASLTPSGSAWPSAADVCLCTLSEVLEDGPLPTRYYLSAKACQGILRRAAKRGKALPAHLQVALRAAAASTPEWNAQD